MQCKLKIHGEEIMSHNFPCTSLILLAWSASVTVNFCGEEAHSAHMDQVTKILGKSTSDSE